MNNPGFPFEEPHVPQVTCEDVKRAMDEHELHTLLDVRTDGEYQRARISGSINIPLDRIECDITSVIPDKSRRIYVYCLSGSRSSHAVDAMRNMGYSNVFDVAQGLLAWRAHYYPVESG